MLDIHLARMWMEVCETGGIPMYWRRMSNGFSVRRVMDKSGVNRMEKRWALFRNNNRVWEVQALPDRYAAIEAAEEYLKEAGIV